MSAESALAHVRNLLRQVEDSAVPLAAELLFAIESARDVLAPLADTSEAAALAHQILADAAAGAAPLHQEPKP